MNINILAWMIIGLAAAALWHFVFEAILLPTIRQEIQFKLFTLRDELRALKANEPEACGDEPFHLLDTSLSWRMDHLESITISFLKRTRDRLRGDSEFRTEVERRLAVLESCKLPEYVRIRQQSNALTLDIVTANSGGWIVYILPIAYTMFIWDKLKSAVRKVNAMPEQEGVEMLGGQLQPCRVS